ncbi:hypothetical protein LWF15_19475 [Kineosporia rhizophila]|uniref:hypothetical protein n=1 Tax=Kineosporia TaxID=49184 RepID=UPI001E5A8748|nr:MULTISPECIES: hypothetical protein [Kineosporia]MCE0537675.1 hypothetical protein [Kineosporia rhizophila]GLY18810.1 hypothetical protein Kisp01_58240 [Kineosporia sp. NBRC 101677]
MSDERGIPPRPLSGRGLTSWACTECGHRVPGTADAPFEGDGTCPRHPDVVLEPEAP